MQLEVPRSAQVLVAHGDANSDGEGERPQRALSRRRASFMFNPNRVLSLDVSPFRRLPPVPASVETGNGQRDRSDALMCRVAEGDQRAFAALYDELGNVMHGIILRVVRDPAHAEEVAQEALLDLWRRDRTTTRSWARSELGLQPWLIAGLSTGSELSRRAATGTTGWPGDRFWKSTVPPSRWRTTQNENGSRALVVLTPLQRQTLELAY